jgi:hypothetical protein
MGSREIHIFQLGCAYSPREIEENQVLHFNLIYKWHSTYHSLYTSSWIEMNGR